MQFSWRLGLICFHLVGACLQLVSAVPAAKDVSTSSAESSTPGTASTSTHIVSTSGAVVVKTGSGRQPGQDGSDDATQTDLPDRRPTSDSTSTTSKHSIIIAPTASVRPTTHPHPTWTGVLGTTFTRHFPPPTATAPSRAPPVAPASSGQPPVAIAFEVLGGLVAVGLLAGIARCFIVWRRTPPRDRIAALMSRHQLEREMEEMERERMERLNQALEARRWRPPPPPYQPPPPDYETVPHSDSPPPPLPPPLPPPPPPPG
ncbi:uncharacterized protein TRAVEDRAFT_27209 [Trametes versicolor FP-101664 SS1]|uniref:uncharacterized protein n=1 Tax=Trametes versicolor (strain FP-101664) TaxID=717944 RepID=UPI00046225EE|nr:uncharacterized protein TRAVEDRAFT_27209 [Trametes versicolor FP-101664 SS1]EIW61687.1 hypothetical protein TRAVEDRAFT_27209 [Trametes versicolor FP-101664 SS1]